MDAWWVFIILFWLTAAALTALHVAAFYGLFRLARYGWRRFANRNANPS